MNSGSISYSPDYKSEPDLPEGWGLVETLCVDGRHRYLPDAPKCGCGATINRVAERARLEREVVERCSAYCASVVDMEENGYPKDITANEWHGQHLEKQTAMIDAYKALATFEAEQEKKTG